MSSRLEGVSFAILAGGLGTRLRSSVPDRPKVLAPVAGKPFLAHLLDQLARAGARQVTLLVGYAAEMVQAAFGDYYAGLALQYSREPEPLGTGGAVCDSLCLNWMKIQLFCSMATRIAMSTCSNSLPPTELAGISPR